MFNAGVFVIARLTFREASRRWILGAALVLGLLFLAIYGVGVFEITKEVRASMSGRVLVQNEMMNFMLLAGLYVVNFLNVMMTVLTSVDTLAGEISSGTMQTLVSKPVQRWEILLGKWLGFSVMLTLYLLLMAGGVMGLVWAIAGYVAPNALLGLLLMWMNTLLLLSVTLWGGTMLSTLANGVLVFGLYGLAFIGGWVEQIGSFLNNDAAVNIGIVCSLILPSEALWKRAAFEMQSAIVGLVGASPFNTSSVPSPLMVGYAVLYTGVVLALALRQFRNRDL
jgi:ABC-type transport system involved in multi-copper enzyme maturation permease subunit